MDIQLINAVINEMDDYLLDEEDPGLDQIDAWQQNLVKFVSFFEDDEDLG